ncbi:MAG: hypothetical protein ACE5GE_12580, partial [Phycisphaerae bacterium]
ASRAFSAGERDAAALTALAVANLSRAELCCRNLLDRYPDSDRAKDARHMLDSINAARPQRHP